MARVILLGATGSLGRHVLHQAMTAGHAVTVLVRTPSKLPDDAQSRVSIETGDLSVMAPAELRRLVGSHDALLNCAGNVRDGQGFVDLVDKIVTSVDGLPTVCWLLAGAALLDIDAAGRRGVDMPEIASTYWPHRANFERLRRCGLDWRLLCPGPMVEEQALGLERMRVSIDRLPVHVPESIHAVKAFVSLVPQMIVPYADAAALMLANLGRGGAMARRRVGIALPEGMTGRKP